MTLSHRRKSAPQPAVSGRRWFVSPLGATIVGVTALLAVVAVAALFHVRALDSGAVSAPPAAHTGVPGSPTTFAYLSAQHSSFCSLQRSSVEADADTMRLQGACCSAMDMAKYQEQVRGLRQFTSIPQIPRDPYDVPVPLARGLFHDDDTIVLDGAHQATYDAAMGMTMDKGPCCCHCWRWSMTEGLAKRLITVNHLDAATVARVVDLVNGCGGPLGTSATPSAYG